jgi:hypothetical protein
VGVAVARRAFRNWWWRERWVAVAVGDAVAGTGVPVPVGWGVNVSVPAPDVAVTVPGVSVGTAPVSVGTTVVAVAAAGVSVGTTDVVVASAGVPVGTTVVAVASAGVPDGATVVGFSEVGTLVGFSEVGTLVGLTAVGAGGVSSTNALLMEAMFKKETFWTVVGPHERPNNEAEPVTEVANPSDDQRRLTEWWTVPFIPLGILSVPMAEDAITLPTPIPGMGGSIAVTTIAEELPEELESVQVICCW